MLQNFEVAHKKRKLRKANSYKSEKKEVKNDLSSEDKHKIRRSQFYIRQGDVSGATNIMLSNGLCDTTPSIKDQLIKKHPREDEYNVSYPDALPVQICASFDDVKHAITRIKRTKAPGPDGWRSFYWKSILGFCFEERIIKKLVILINKVFNGSFNDVLGPNFSTSRGVLIAKDQSRKNVRPIAIGLSFRRICTSIINRKMNEVITGFMSSMNLGNSRNGISIFVHLIRNLIDFKELKKDKDFSVIEFDVHNAFNDIKRSYRGAN